MNGTMGKHGVELTGGTYVRGKWNGRTYLIQGNIGSGTVGSVYLCEYKGRQYALKVSKQSTSITMEVNVLKALKKVQGQHLGPSLIDVDDWKSPIGVTYSFYVMEYLQGNSVTSFLKNNGSEWLAVFMLQLLGDLDKLHQLGWVFGDLKLDNIIIMPSPPRVRLVDVGGTTQMGRAVKEYTEFYDRGYWGLGSRRAEPSYDLFAVVMVCLATFYPNHFPKKEHSTKEIFHKINSVPALELYRDCLKQAILGKYKSAHEMKQELLHHFQKQQQKKQFHTATIWPLLVETGGILLLAIAYFLSSIFLL